jgi:hypothetical protein
VIPTAFNCTIPLSVSPLALASAGGKEARTWFFGENFPRSGKSPVDCSIAFLYTQIYVGGAYGEDYGICRFGRGVGKPAEADAFGDVDISLGCIDSHDFWRIDRSIYGES